MTASILTFERRPEDDFYALLGCDELSTTEQIQTEYKIRALALHPDKNFDDKETGEKFCQLQRAKQILADPSLRSKYDQWRRCGLAIPFDDWLAKRDRIHMSMHWMGQKPKAHALEETQPESSVDQGRSAADQVPATNPQQSINELFRSYKI